MNDTVAPPCVSPIRHSSARRYEDDWRRLRRHPEALRRAAAWGIVRPPIAALDEVLLACGHDTPASPSTEANLRRLVELAADDTLAARVVVRRLLPGAVSSAVRYQYGRGADALDELVGALWIGIRSFDPRRRPATLSAALLHDAVQRAFHAGARRQMREVPSAHVDDRPGVGFGDESDADPAAELAAVLDVAAATGAVAADEIALLRLIAQAPDAATVARQLNVTERTVRNRRARATAKLRAAALAA